MSININNLVSKPVDTVHMVHGGDKIRDVLRKLIKKQDTTVVILGEHDKMPGGFADYKKQRKVKTRHRKGERRYGRQRRRAVTSIL